MRSCTWIILLLFLLTGCKSKNQIPKGILPQVKMQGILWDLTRADLFLSDFRFRKDSSLNREAESIKMYQQIFALHQTNKEEFQKSFAFYKARPVLFRAIVDSLDRRNSAPTELARPQNRADTNARSTQERFQQRDSMRFKKKVKKNLE